MIPEFPNFKKLELEDKTEVESFTLKFPPYSDFSFISMWAWDIKGEMRLSKLNGNLVVLFTDYLTGEPFYSFLGNYKVNETANALLDFSKKQNIKPVLKLIHAEALEGIDRQKFKVAEDADHFDYVYKISELKDLNGGKFSKKRNQVSLFRKNHPTAIAKLINLKDKSIQASIINLCVEWLKIKVSKEELFESHEEAAVNRLILAINVFDPVGVGIFLDGKMIAFIINELTNSDYVIAHASKIDRSYMGVNSFLIKSNAEILASLNKNLFNYEQDLGVKSLRDAKSRFRPIMHLKKYQLTHI